jgi:hypothetical protein
LIKFILAVLFIKILIQDNTRFFVLELCEHSNLGAFIDYLKEHDAPLLEDVFF